MALVVIGTLPIISFFGVALVDHLIGVIFCFMFQACRGLGQVLLKDALNKRVTGDFRATANSIGQMGTRIFFVIVSPAYGYLIDKYGLSFASQIFGGFYFILFFLIMVPILKQKANFQKL